jgi:hypothetical protein
MSQSESRNIGGGAISEVELARVVLVPKWRGILSGGSGFVNLIANLNLKVKYHNVIPFHIEKE